MLRERELILHHGNNRTFCPQSCQDLNKDLSEFDRGQVAMSRPGVPNLFDQVDQTAVLFSVMDRRGELIS